MEPDKKVLKRREFLEWLAVAGVGGIGSMHLNLPLFQNDIARKDLPENRQLINTPQAQKISFHIFSKHLQFLDYNGMAEVAAEIGFDGVDLSVRPGGHVLPEKVADDLPVAVAAIRQQGLLATMMTTAITDAAGRITKNVLRTAGKLGISHYRTNWLWYDENKGIEENLSDFKQILGALGKLNQELNITGDYQNHAGFNGHPLGSPIWDLAAVLDELNNPKLGCQYDIRHATVEGATSWPLGLKRIYPHINTLVVKDFKWDKRDGQWQIINTPIGEGMVDFKKFFSLLKGYNISAPVSVHFEYDMPEHQKGLTKEQIRQQTIRLMQQDLNKLKAFRKQSGLE
ncbi:xylose isomerase-like TIM barrel protein [Flammeovirgaceae bacterium 311]|nr:xylose isomerase-like TIM barrel protein [Flammeovirgaceae bacterium 311]